MHARTQFAALLLASFGTLLAGARAQECPGDPGHVLTSDSVFGIGEQLVVDVTAPPGRTGVLLVANDGTPFQSLFGKLCINGLIGVVTQFNGTGSPETIAWCDMPCEAGLIGFKGYLQFIAFDLPEWGVSNGVCFTIADQLGAGQAYNVFAQGDIALQNGKAGGRVAAGNDIALTDHSVGSQLSNSQGGRDDLIAAGNLLLTDTSIDNGNATYGDGSGNSLVNVQTPNGAVVQRGTPFDTTDEFVLLKRRFTQLASYAITGTNSASGRLLTLTGTDLTRNVFVIWEGELETKYTIEVNVPPGSTAIINITGEEVDVIGDLTIGGTAACNTVWNFCEATSITFHDVVVDGTILAPCAAVELKQGTVNGSVIAASLRGDGHCINEQAFCGCISLF